LILARNSKTTLNRSGESWEPCLIPDFKGNSFSCSPFDMMLALDLSYIAFIMLRNISSIPSSFRAFIIKGCWIFQRLSLCLLRVICGFCLCFCLYSVLCLWIYICWAIFAFLEWNWLGVLLNSVCEYLVENLCIYIH
jgi:hypothetical protein